MMAPFPAGQGPMEKPEALPCSRSVQATLWMQDPREITSNVVVEGTATGVLMGGNLGMIGRAIGWACPSFAGAILLIEAVDTFIGVIDGTLTQLRRSGCLDGLRGVAVGQFIRRAKTRKVVGD
jgi:muramoyltetrapeptide carboxypeptidase